VIRARIIMGIVGRYRTCFCLGKCCSCTLVFVCPCKCKLRAKFERQQLGYSECSIARLWWGRRSWRGDRGTVIWARLPSALLLIRPANATGPCKTKHGGHTAQLQTCRDVGRRKLKDRPSYEVQTIGTACSCRIFPRTGVMAAGAAHHPVDVWSSNSSNALQTMG